MMNDKKLRQVLLALETASQNHAVREARATVLTEMEYRKRRDLNPSYLQREFKEKGGIVHDVMTLLERVGRLRADGRWQDNDDVVLRIQSNALLVGSHALRPVLETLNEQHLYWERRDPPGSWSPFCVPVTHRQEQFRRKPIRGFKIRRGNAGGRDRFLEIFKRLMQVGRSFFVYRSSALRFEKGKYLPA